MQPGNGGNAFREPLRGFPQGDVVVGQYTPGKAAADRQHENRNQNPWKKKVRRKYIAVSFPERLHARSAAPRSACSASVSAVIFVEIQPVEKPDHHLRVCQVLRKALVGYVVERLAARL